MADLPTRTDWVGVKCGHCQSTNTVIELYDHTGPEGNCLDCTRGFPPHQNTIQALADRLPMYRRYTQKGRRAA